MLALIRFLYLLSTGLQLETPTCRLFEINDPSVYLSKFYDIYFVYLGLSQ